ncbi:hypothetical protein CAPTEDRAFT_227932 [Capitella teleta]|uniref:Uncharacterized protein n=1 Tax=Capitella teleta TaxID=283909 RepID=R7TK03_CAPTE|nr:hypothetical protein CAPTEDRAFT_227932 [Capitella teleta]|eukprot:ELT94054.1 hypothetical protein CAPTEDRAFT_227932 [Capitella teleta]
MASPAAAAKKEKRFLKDYDKTSRRFINARRRIVQPMIDQSNRAGPPNTYSPDGSMGYMDGSQQMMRGANYSGRSDKRALWILRAPFRALTCDQCRPGPVASEPAMQGMHDMYGASPNSGSYGQMQLRPPVHSQAMLIPGHPHAMMMAHGGHMAAHPGMHGLSGAQSPPLHGSMDAMAHIQDIHAG